MTANHSWLEKLSFSGKSEDFAAFIEQFNLEKCLEDKLTVPAYKEDETNGEETARVNAENKRKKLRFMLWCEHVQCLDIASINFIRLHKPDGVEAWKAIVGKQRSIESPAFRRSSLSWLD